MRRIFLIVGPMFCLALLLFKFYQSERAAAQLSQTHSGVAVKTPLRPEAITQKPVVPPTSSDTNSVAEADEEKEFKLSAEQIAAYLGKYHRSAESLLTAFDECHDKALLKEAAEKFPNDPRVQLAVLSQEDSDKELTPEERKLWLDRFKKGSPDNGFPNVLAAADNLKNGQTDRALEELKDADKKPGMNKFYLEQMQSREEMYLAAGLSPQEAKTQALSNLNLSVEAMGNGVLGRLDGLKKDYLTAGDKTSAAQIAAVETKLGQRWDDPNSSPLLVSESLGSLMQRIALRNLDPDTYYDFLGKTAGERMTELNTQKEEIKSVIRDLGKYYPQMSEPDRMIYMDRFKMFGERNAVEWLRQAYGPADKK